MVSAVVSLSPLKSADSACILLCDLNLQPHWRALSRLNDELNCIGRFEATYELVCIKPIFGWIKVLGAIITAW